MSMLASYEGLGEFAIVAAVLLPSHSSPRFSCRFIKYIAINFPN